MSRTAGSPEAAAGAVARYFSDRYPQKARVAGIPVLRRGEEQRLELVRRWVPRWDGIAVLDAGCGDGAFLERAMTGTPARLALEDVSAAQVARAAERLAGRADCVETRAADVCAPGASGCFDVVLALGVSDYVADWPALVRALMARSAGMVIADFPRRGRPHHLLRTVWLALHGVRLATGSRARMDAVLRECGARAEIVPLPLHWMVRIHAGTPRA